MISGMKRKRGRRTYGTGSLRLIGKTWWIRIRRGGNRTEENTGTGSREEAENFLKRRLGEMASGVLPGPAGLTVSSVCKLVVEDYRRRQFRDVAHVEWRINKHVEPELGAIRASKLGSAHLNGYIDKRRQDRAANSTINRELAIIRRGFSLALQADPPLVARVPFIRALPEENVREGFIEYKQYKAILEKLPDRLKALFVAGYHTGVRIGELRKWKWDQVDLKAGEVRLSGRQTKNKKPRTVPVYGDMRAWLDMQKTERDTWWPACPWVFFYQGRQIGGHLKGWKEACEAAELPGLRFHDLRRSAVRNLERAGVPRKVAMAITGHRTEAVYRRYDIVAPQDLKTAVVKLDRHLQEQAIGEKLGNGDTQEVAANRPKLLI